MAKKAQKAKPAARPAPRRAKAKATTEGNERKAFVMISRKDLTSLLDQTNLFQKRASSANGSLGDLIKDYAQRKHLHRGAFRMFNRLWRMGQDDPAKLWVELAHFDDMRVKMGLDKIAERQGQLLPAIADEGETQTEEVGEVEETTGAFANYPRAVEERAGAA